MAPEPTSVSASPWAAVRARVAAAGGALRLSRAAGSSLRWKPGAVPQLTAHPAALISADFTPVILRCAERPGSRAPRGLAAALQAAFARRPADDPIWFAAAMGETAIANLARLQGLAGAEVAIRCNDNRRLLIASRRRSLRLWEFDCHHRLLDETAAVDDLARYARRAGNGGFKRLDRVLHRVFEAIHADLPNAAPDPDVLALPTIDPARPLTEVAADIHARYFADLPLVPISWSRDPGRNRHLRSIRFGSFRSRPKPHIRIHPRLRQRWIARVFLDHVIHHEYCHFRQFRQPLRGEAHHSRRFRNWEREFASYRAALAWERANLSRILGSSGDCSSGD